MKFKTLIIDDEPIALTRLRRILRPYSDTIEIIGQAQDGAEAIKQINELKPDLIFLDIQMPEYNGFEVVEHIHYNPIIIFITAYDEFALKAFETNSIDYLLKPVDSKRLKKTIVKLNNITDNKKTQFENQIERMLAFVKSPSLKRIHIKENDRIFLIDLINVYFFQALDKYVEVHQYNTNHLMTNSLTKLNSELPSEDFVQIHRSAIINLNYVDEIIKMSNSSYQVRLKDKAKTVLPVSRYCISKLAIKS